MTIEDRGVIDTAYVHGDDIVLVIADNLDWAKPLEHIHALQEKINDYFTCIESGQARDVGTGQDKYVIRIVLQHAPPPIIDEFISAVERAASGKFALRVTQGRAQQD